MDDEQRSQERRIGLPEEEKGGAERCKEGGKEKKEGRSPSNQPQGSQSSQSSDPAPPPGVTDTDSPGELPQCMLGNRKVDDMSFMISCTNWY